MTNTLPPEIVRLLLVLAATLAAHMLTGRALKKAGNVAALTENIWDDALIEAARRPLPLFIWLIGGSIALKLIHRQTGELLIDYLMPARDIGFVVCIAWFLFRLIREAANNMVAARERSGTPLDRTTIDALSKVARITVLVLSALVIVQTLGFSISGVLAFGGVGGIAVGFAAKDLLANFFGGMMVHLDRPFNVGETIRSPDKQIEGRVEHIGWRQTVIRSRDMTPLYVPNSLFSTIVVENPSRMSHRRIREVVGLRYDDLDKVRPIVEKIDAMLRKHPEIESEQGIVVALDQFADSSVNILIQAFCKATEAERFHQAKQEILLSISEIIADQGADIAFPTRTLHIQQG